MLRLRGTSVATGVLPVGTVLDYSEGKPCIYVIEQGTMTLTVLPSDTADEIQSGDVVLIVNGVSHQLANSGDVPAR